MTDFQNNARLDLDALTHPLARTLATIRTAIAGLDEAGIRNAMARMDGAFQELRNYPADIAETDLIKADRIVRDALEAENAARIARDAPWLAVHIKCEAGRWLVSVFHDEGEALRREFANAMEARAAGETLRALLLLQGRDLEFTIERPRAAGDEPLPF